MAQGKGEEWDHAREARSPLATRHEARAYLRVSRKSFDRHIAPHLTKVPIGTRIFYEWKELAQWLESQRVGPSRKIRGTVSTRSASGTRESESCDPRASEILKRLRSKQHGSTPRFVRIDERDAGLAK